MLRKFFSILAIVVLLVSIPLASASADDDSAFAIKVQATGDVRYARHGTNLDWCPNRCRNSI